MKKALSVCLAALLLLSLAACGSNSSHNSTQEQNVVSEDAEAPDAPSTVFTITREDGTTETLTADELKEIHDTNELNFDENYADVSVEAEGTISKVERESQLLYMLGSAEFVDVVRFTLEDSVQFQLTPLSLDELGLDASQITAGTKVRVAGSLGYANFTVVINNPSSVALVEA